MKLSKTFARVLLLTFVLCALMCAVGVTVMAAETGDTGSGTSAGTDWGFGPGMAYLGAGLSTGIAAIGGGIAVGGGAPAAIGALTEDPKSFGKSLIFVALGEGIALYGMLISILILNKV